MYLPKIWGNTRLLHRSVLAAGALGGACTTLPGTEETHTIASHWASTACRPAPGPTQPEFDLEALGDFPISGENYEHLKSEAQDLLVPPATRSAALAASDGFTNFVGLGLPASGKDIDVSLWPKDAPCAIPVATDCGYPGAGDGYALGVSEDERTLLVAGGGAPLEGAPEPDPSLARAAAVVDLGTGKVSCIPPERGLQSGRAGATITALGSKLLVAGGTEPVRDTAQLTAEIFDPGTGEFDPDPIPLLRDGRNGRAHHAAVTLASGETLLVGGVDATGFPLSTLEAISPEAPHHRNENDESTREASLEAPRVDPFALRLSDDRVFIAGGKISSDSPRQVEQLVWLDKDARTIEHTLETLACPADQAGKPPTKVVGSVFASMPGGAVLAVGGCALPVDGAPVSPVSCTQHCQGELGCLTSEIFWIDREGGVTCCGAGRATCNGPPPRFEDASFGAFLEPVLVSGEDGRPWLLEGERSARTLHRFDPWTGQFPSSGVATGTAASSIVAAPADAALFLWLDQCTVGATTDCNTSLHGFRHTSQQSEGFAHLRGPYTQAAKPLLLNDTEGVALARAPSAPPGEGAVALRPWLDQTRAMDGRPGTLNLHLTPDSELVLTDTTYEGVHVEIPVRAGPPPVVHLGSMAFGSTAKRAASCQWPVAAPRAPFVADVVRGGDRVTLTIGDRTRDCDGPVGRVSISVGAEATPITVEPISVTRIATP
jgi:hypothetical protein